MKSIKSKIVFLSVALLFALGIIVVTSALLGFYHERDMRIESTNASITAFEGQINTEIAELEKNAMDLALIGEIYFQKSRQQPVGEFYVQELLKNYPKSMGIGIYFAPYKINVNQKNTCIHALWDENKQISLLSSCINGTFDYIQQNWYSELMKEFEAKKRVAWSRPYKSTQLGNLMTTVSAGIYDHDNLVGMATVDWELGDILASILKIKPTPNSFVLFADKTNDYIMATTEPEIDNETAIGTSLKTLKWYSEDLKEGTVFDYKGVKYIPYIKKLNNGMFLIVNVPLFELFQDVVYHMCALLGILLICTLLVVFVIYQVLKRNINQPIDKLTATAKEISHGDLEKTIYLEEPSELAELASAFNKMKTDIKTHLTELAQISLEKEKMASELAIAKNIQDSVLPKDFPKNEYYELAASMTPAREVGGDFYDFFPIDENHIGLVMADVCGKGITAALYMMSAKTAIKNMLQAGYPLKEAIGRANNSLCDNGAPLMFVTAFIGILDLRTGKVEYINAGHCPPLLQKKQEYKYVDVIKNMVLGVKPDYDYKVGQISLNEHDRLFLYTDGVTEAQTKDCKFLGYDYLLDILNQKKLPLADTLEYIHKSIKKFVKDAPQFDDITMLIVEFYHKK